MTHLNIAHHRLDSQRINAAACEKPSEVVRWLGAVQAQDYGGAKWALGLRMQNATDDDIEQAFAEGAILRTHIMRPTWHFVAPADIHWLLALTAPRVHAALAFLDRKLGLDNAIFKRSNAIMRRILRGGNQLLRDELRVILRQSGIPVDGEQRMAHVLMHAELDGIICSGARRGKQFTYALLDERAPVVITLPREEALAELTRRYFSSHGPATEEDFMWWSGLSRVDVKSGLEMVKRQLAHDLIDEKTYWFAASTLRTQHDAHCAYLLPNFDEYVVGYTDRSAIFDSTHADKQDDRRNPLFQYTLVINGQIVGTWKRTLGKNAVTIETNRFTRLTHAENRAVALAARRYGEFLELPAVLSKI